MKNILERLDRHDRLEQKETEDLIKSISGNPSGYRSLGLEIINFSFVPIIKILQEVQYSNIEIKVHHYCDLDEKDFAQTLADFANALQKQHQLHSFSFIQDSSASRSPEFNDAIVACICHGLSGKKNDYYEIISFQGLVSDTGVNSIADLIKKQDIVELILANNDIGSQSAITFIESLLYPATRYFKHRTLDLSANKLNDQVVNAILLAPKTYTIHTHSNSLLSSSAQKRLADHKSHIDFINNHHHFNPTTTESNFSILKKPKLPTRIDDSQTQELIKSFFSTPDYSYAEQESKSMFSLPPTSEFSVTQLLKLDPKLWKKSCIDESSPKLHKDVVICAASAILFDSLFLDIPGIFYWQGNPNYLGTSCDEKFTPAIAEDVQELLERTQPGRQFWVIDERIWQIWQQQRINFYNSHRFIKSTIFNLSLFPHHKEIDLSLNKLWMTDDLFKKIVPGLSKTTTEIELQNCLRLNPQTIAGALPRFPQLKFLGLRDTQPWGDDELALLIQSCPFLEELEICIDTLAPLKILPQLNELQNLYLDLSNNQQLEDLNFLKENNLGKSITLLKLSNCTNLIDLTGLQYCPNLAELWLENIEIPDGDGLIKQLGQLHKLKLWIVHQCQHTLPSSELAILTNKYIRYVFISTNKNKGSKFLQSRNSYEIRILSEQLEQDRSNLTETKSCEKLNCVQTPSDRAQRKCSASQVFWDSKGQWPDHRLDRWSICDVIDIKTDGHIIFTTSPIAQRGLTKCPEVKVMPYEAINTELLQGYELKSQHRYYAGQLTLNVSSDTWTPIPSRGVFSRPVASSEHLHWARSAVTGELFVRLPKTPPLRKKIRLRYAFLAVDITHQRQMKSQSLPPLIKNAFTTLCESEILVNFPAFQKLLIADLSWTQCEDQAIYALIHQYCQMEPLLGFTDEPLNNQASHIVRQFVDSLSLPNPQTAADLALLFDALLQQKGTCPELSRCAKLLCDYFDIPCHIGLSKTHIFIDYAIFENGKLITRTADLGGGAGQFTPHPLPLTSIRPPAEIKTPTLADQRLAVLERHKIHCLAQALTEFKPVILKGSNCHNRDDYWQQLLSCPTPIIYLTKEEPAYVPKFLAALREYSQQQPGLSPQQIFYIKDPERLISWWETVHVADNKFAVVPGWLQHFLLDETPRILVLDLAKFEQYDLASNQGIGDKNRTLNGLSLPIHIKVICLAPQTLAREDIFSSRFIPFSSQADLFAETKPIEYLRPADEKALTLPPQHLYGDPDADCLGIPQLEGDSLNFTPGPLAEAMAKKHDQLFSDVPNELHDLLYLTTLTGQTQVNGEMQAFADITLYQTKHPQAESEYIRFVSEIQTNQSRFYANPHSNSQLVIGGGRRIDPESGRSYSLPPLVLTDDLPDVIVVTHSMPDHVWHRLVDGANQRNKPVCIYLCPGVKIAGYTEPFQEQQIDKKPLLGSHVIESNAPEATLQWLIRQGIVSADNVLTLTPEVSLELLALINRKGERFLLNYQPGWLLSQLRNAKTIVLIGNMPTPLFEALESLFSEQSHLYTNEGRETFSGRLIWIKSSSHSRPFAPTVARRRHNLELKTAPVKKIAKTDQSPIPYRKKVDQIRTFIQAKDADVIFLELMGPPGSGKTTSVTKAVNTIRQDGQLIQHFFSVDEYVAWRKLNPSDTETLCVLQLDDCRMSPPEQLEFLRDINRNHHFYWQGAWYPGLKVIMTNNPESDLRNDKHPLLADLHIPSLSFTPFTSAELDEYIIQPLLQEIKAIGDSATPIGALMLSAYQYVAKTLPHACISSRELTTVCQRLAVLQALHAEEKPMQVATRACYEEFFGLFENENQRQDFWKFLQQSADLTVDEQWIPIPVDVTLTEKLQKQGLQLTDQGGQMVSMIQRLLQIRELHGQKDFPGKCGLLLEGPPGILKTELSIAVLEAHGITAAPEIPDGKPHYFNLTAGDPELMEKKLRQAYQHRWVVVCNELNLLKPSTIQLLLKLLEAPKTGFCLIATQNHHRAGSGRKPLPPAIKNRLQVFYLRDYNRDELIGFAKKHGLREAALLADMFLGLQTYQTLHQLALANPRHYFRWLTALAKLPQSKRSLAVIAHQLLAAGCHLPLSPEKNVKPGQYHAVEFILKRVPAQSFPHASGLTNPSKYTLTNSQTARPSRPQSLGSDRCLVM